MGRKGPTSGPGRTRARLHDNVPSRFHCQGVTEKVRHWYLLFVLCVCVCGGGGIRVYIYMYACVCVRVFWFWFCFSSLYLCFSSVCMLRCTCEKKKRTKNKLKKEKKTKSASPSRALTQPRCTDRPRLGDNFSGGTHLLEIVTALILSTMVASWNPTGAILGGGSVWDVVVQLGPDALTSQIG